MYILPQLNVFKSSQRFGLTLGYCLGASFLLLVLNLCYQLGKVASHLTLPVQLPEAAAVTAHSSLGTLLPCLWL